MLRETNTRKSYHIDQSRVTQICFVSLVYRNANINYIEI